jgi:LysR family transcriptional regulator (chromosome initiation inhibitor)
MIDYQAIAALAAVIETQAFQSAAGLLFITQSAVSQRIKALEQYYGEPVLIRTLPYRPTELGLTLLGHYKRVSMLEDVLKTTLKQEAAALRLSISVSRDSLETWFTSVIRQLADIMPVTIEIIADDQDRTLQYLQKGLVSACASTNSKALSGCKAELLGYFDYALVASPSFKKKYFKSADISKKELLTAPTLLFDQHDKLHQDYLKHYFKMEDVNLNHCHVVPSVAGFKQFALDGYAYVLIPCIDIVNELKQKKLVNLFPDKMWKMPVYWHSFEIETEAYRKFNELVLRVGRKILRQG